MTDPTPAPVAAYGTDPADLLDAIRRDHGVLVARRYERWAEDRRLSDLVAEAVAPAADLPADPHGIQAPRDYLVRIPEEDAEFRAAVARLRGDPATLERLADLIYAELAESDPESEEAADLRRQLDALVWLSDGS
jgi:hypothetical protein